jgi:hypothetical protein
MFFSAQHAPDARCGIVIDVGSASVAAAIVVSEIGEAQPTVVWTYTERCPITNEPDTVTLAKKVISTLVNVSMEIGSNGLKTLAAHDKRLRPTSVQVAVGAPWSYTIPKQIRYARDEAFTVSAELLQELATTAERETTEAQAASPLFDSLGLEVISSSTSHYTANGYHVVDPTGQTTTELSLVRKVTICQKRLVDAIREVHENMAPRATLGITSFMEHMQQQILTTTITSKTYGLIDISGDATEVGVVVDGVLQNVLSNTWGHYTVAREIAAITFEPVTSAFARLQETGSETLTCTPATQQTECNLVFSRFSEELAHLIARAAQMTELPAHFIVHSDTGLRDFARNTTTSAINQITHSAHTSVATVSEKLTNITSIPETRLALSVAVFHTRAIT